MDESVNTASLLLDFGTKFGKFLDDSVQVRTYGWISACWCKCDTKFGIVAEGAEVESWLSVFAVSIRSLRPYIQPLMSLQCMKRQ